MLKSVLKSILAFALAVAGHSAYAQERPNIVLIMADDMGFDSVGAYGGQSYATPNLDRLAAQGMQFNRAYATPLCTNTRLQLMTGYYQNRNFTAFGILPTDAKTIGHYMADAGYTSLIAGKWQLQSYDPPSWPGAETRRGTGMHPRDAGFDEFSLYHTGHTELKGSRYADPVIETQDGFLTGTEGQYGPDIWTNTIIDFIDRKAGGEEPFFVYYAMALPHGPFTPTPDSPEWADPAMRHTDQSRFYGDMVEYTDKVVGRIVDHLDAAGLGENTLVLFSSDNGTFQGILSQWNGRLVQGGKGLTNEQGIRVPMIARWTGRIAAGSHSEALADSTDILPTLLDAAGTGSPQDANLDGHSFLPVTLGKAAKARDWVFFHHETRPGYDKDRYHLVRLALNEEFKLYEDGRMFRVDSDDIYEDAPMMPASDTPAERDARLALQRVLDSMKPYRHYDPATMPRPNFAAEVFAKHRYDEQAGLIVMEAERGIVPQNETWHAENLVPGSTGSGYVRALRDQAKQPTLAALTIPISIKSEQSDWSLRIRNRSDDADAAKPSAVWVKVNDGAWTLYSTANDGAHRGWKWSSLEDGPVLSLGEGEHVISLAPYNDNVKIDRLVLMREDRWSPVDLNALAESPYHPWFN